MCYVSPTYQLHEFIRRLTECIVGPLSCNQFQCKIIHIHHIAYIVCLLIFCNTTPCNTCTVPSRRSGKTRGTSRPKHHETQQIATPRLEITRQNAYQLLRMHGQPQAACLKDDHAARTGNPAPNTNRSNGPWRFACTGRPGARIKHKHRAEPYTLHGCHVEEKNSACSRGKSTCHPSAR